MRARFITTRENARTMAAATTITLVYSLCEVVLLAINFHPLIKKQPSGPQSKICRNQTAIICNFKRSSFVFENKGRVFAVAFKIMNLVFFNLFKAENVFGVILNHII